MDKQRRLHLPVVNFPVAVPSIGLNGVTSFVSTP
jgi:hypothetical protein